MDDVLDPSAIAECDAPPGTCRMFTASLDRVTADYAAARKHGGDPYGRRTLATDDARRKPFFAACFLAVAVVAVLSSFSARRLPFQAVLRGDAVLMRPRESAAVESLGPTRAVEQRLPEVLPRTPGPPSSKATAAGKARARQRPAFELLRVDVGG